MTMRVTRSGNFHVIIMSDGNFVRTSACEFFLTKDRTQAEEAVAYLTQDVPHGGKRVGAHWLKSTFGVF